MVQNERTENETEILNNVIVKIYLDTEFIPFFGGGYQGDAKLRKEGLIRKPKADGKV